MENAYLEIAISDIQIPATYDDSNTLIRVLMDNKQIKDIPLNKLSIVAKTKLTRNDELVVLQIISQGRMRKEKELDCLFMPTEFFLDVPVSGTSTTGLPMRELESWLFFDENGYLKQQPQREGPKGICLRLSVTEFAGSPSPRKSQKVTTKKTTTITTTSQSSSLGMKSAERRDRTARAPQQMQEFSPEDEVILEQRTTHHQHTVSRGVLEKQVRDCDPVTLVVFTEESYGKVKTELRDELEETISRERREQLDERMAIETISKLESTLSTNIKGIRDTEIQRIEKLEPKRTEILDLVDTKTDPFASTSEHSTQANRLLEVQALLNKKLAELQQMKEQNTKITGILNSRDQFESDTESLRKNYSDSIGKNISHQKENLTMVIGEIEEDTENLRNARQIGYDLKALTTAFSERGEGLKTERREELFQLEQEENDIAKKIRQQERDMADYDLKIKQAQDDIAAN